MCANVNRLLFSESINHCSTKSLHAFISVEVALLTVVKKCDPMISIYKFVQAAKSRYACESIGGRYTGGRRRYACQMETASAVVWHSERFLHL